MAKRTLATKNNNRHFEGVLLGAWQFVCRRRFVCSDRKRERERGVSRIYLSYTVYIMSAAHLIRSHIGKVNKRVPKHAHV